MFLGLVAIVFAITTAFAFKPEPVVNFGYWNGTICKPTASTCSGSNQACRVDISEVAGDDLIPLGDRDNSCAQLSMQ